MRRRGTDRANSVAGDPEGMAKMLLEFTRWACALLSPVCILATWLFDPRSGTALTLLCLFLLFGSAAVMLSMYRPLPAAFRKIVG
jgi:hypothetical protein